MADALGDDNGMRPGPDNQGAGAPADANQLDNPGEPVLDQRTRVLGALATFLIVVLATGLGSLLVDVPPNLPSDLPSALLWFGGAVLLGVAAVVATFFGPVRDRMGTFLRALPGRVRQAFGRRPGRILALVIAVVAVTSVAAVVPGPAETSALESGDITILSAIDQSPSDPRRILINQWNQTHPDSQVKVADAPGSTDEQHDSMVNDARDRQDADIYLLDNVWMAEFIKYGYIRPLDESLRQSGDGDFFPNVLATCRDTYGGRAGLWGLPLNTDAGLMFVRSGIPSVSVPKSWDGYLGAEAKTTLAAVQRLPLGSAKPQAEDAAQFASTEILTVTALEAIWASGGQIVNKDGRAVLNADRTAVQFDEPEREGLRNLARAYTDRKITSASAVDDDETSALASFKNGQALYMRNWPVTYDRLKSTQDRAPVPFEVNDLPNESVLGGQNMALSASTERPKAAQAFMEFMTSPSSQLILFNVGGFAPTRPAIYSDVSAVTRPYSDQLRSAVEDARPRPVTPNYTGFSREFRQGVQRALRNDGIYESDFPQKLASFLK